MENLFIETMESESYWAKIERLKTQAQGRRFRDKKVVSLNVIGKDHNFGARPSTNEEVKEHSVENTTDYKLFDDTIIDESWDSWMIKRENRKFSQNNKISHKIRDNKRNIVKNIIQDVVSISNYNNDTPFMIRTRGVAKGMILNQENPKIYVYSKEIKGSNFVNGQYLGEHSITKKWDAGERKEKIINKNDKKRIQLGLEQYNYPDEIESFYWADFSYDEQDWKAYYHDFLVDQGDLEDTIDYDDIRDYDKSMKPSVSSPAEGSYWDFMYEYE